MCTLKSEDSNEVEPSLSTKSSSLLSAHGQPFGSLRGLSIKENMPEVTQDSFLDFIGEIKQRVTPPLPNILRGYLEPHI